MEPDAPKSREISKRGDIKTVAAAAAVLDGRGKKGLLARIWPFLGPAFIACVAYMDPGNFATNIQGGAKFGYMLLWVIFASNFMAMLIQALSAKLGIATGRNLPELCRESYSKPTVLVMWLVAEMVAMATDLAEFLGAALGFQLLFGIPLIWGALLTAVATMIILSLEKYGFRPLEAVITVLVGVIAVCYLAETIFGRPDWGQIAFHSVVPQFKGAESVLLASGILGATVMPHVIYLHSALTQGRIIVREPVQLKRLYKYEIVDVIIAMGVAGFINAAMLIMSAATFFERGLSHIGTIEEAHQTLAPILGNASSWVFAISLLAAGLSSSAVGTMSGQIIMKGFIKRKVPIILRRLVTMLPALIVIFLGLDPTRTLVISQVLLSFGIPFALIPLVLFTANRKLMGVLVNRRITTVAIALVAALIVALNIFLLHQTLWGD
ncbi:manganese/divalent cation transporter [Candidatus Zixiibacteriota bacterium]|nr:manganese/divalent cation transporter [candidate division Zixibacteria bacterium]